MLDDQLGGSPVILAGDFDAEPDSASLRYLTGDAGYPRAWDAVHYCKPCVTLDPANPLHAEQLPDWPFTQIDHVLVRGEVTVVACERVHDSPRDGVWASDHYGLVADLEF